MKPKTWDAMLVAAQNMRMHDCIRIISAFSAANVMEKPKRTRITSRDICVKKDSATGAEGLRMVKVMVTRRPKILQRRQM